MKGPLKQGEKEIGEEKDEGRERYLAAQLFPFFNCTSPCAPIVSFPSLFLSETEQINEEERRARLEKGLGTLVRISFEFSSVFIFARTS